MTDDQFHAHRTTLANNFATAGAELLEFMRAPGTLAAVPNTSPEQYVVAGDLVAIQALLPNRRERRGQRPKDELYFGPEAGQPRRWSILITEGGKGVVADYGYRFPEASAELERVDVVEVTPPATTGASTAKEPRNGEDGYVCPAGKAQAEAARASTVLTDERIIEEARDWGLLDIQDGGRIDRSALISFVREVAAQAGQVAVPEGFALVPKELTKEMRLAGVKLRASRNTSIDGIYAAMLAAAPSPAKESK